MTQHNVLLIHTDIFVPFSNLLLHNAMMLPGLHQTQQVKQSAMVRVSQASTNLDLCHVDIILQENRNCRKQQPC